MVLSKVSAPAINRLFKLQNIWFFYSSSCNAIAAIFIVLSKVSAPAINRPL
jgi:hypothetical protein